MSSAIISYAASHPKWSREHLIFAQEQRRLIVDSNPAHRHIRVIMVCRLMLLVLSFFPADIDVSMSPHYPVEASTFLVFFYKRDTTLTVRGETSDEISCL